MALYIQHESNGKKEPPPNHTLEDVAEEMLNGIFCHYEPPDLARLEEEELAKKNKRRGILRAPKVFRRNKKKGDSSDTPKSVRWSDTHDEEEEKEKAELKKKKQLAASSSSSHSKFPVEISCNLAGTCTEVGIEAGCLSPNTETLVYDDVTTGRRRTSKGQRDVDDDDIRQHPSGETEESEGDADDEEESELAVPPPPPPPKPKTTASKKSTVKSSSTKKKKTDALKEELVFDEDGNPVRANGKRGKVPTPPPPPPRPSSKEKYLPQLSGVKINLPEDDAHLEELARSSREGPPSKRYHRPRQEYDYDDLDDFNNSILEEREDDVRGLKVAKKNKIKSLDDETASNVSAFSSTSSIFKRIWRRSSSSSKSDIKNFAGQLVDSDQVLHRRQSGARSASSFHRPDLDPVELVRSADEAASTKSRAAAVLRVLSPSARNSVEGDWDESIPIVQSSASKVHQAGGARQTRRSHTRDIGSHQGRSRSRSADANRSQSPSLTRSRSMDETNNRLQLPHQRQQPQRLPSRPSGQPLSYYHPAHPLSRTEPDDDRQSLITAHRAGFDRASTVASSYNSEVLERQSYITAHRQSHEPPTAAPPASNAFHPPQPLDDQMERQSFITAHRQGFDAPSRPTVQTYASMPLPPQQHQQYYYAPVPIAVVPPPGYYHPAATVQAATPATTQERSVLPALRGRSPSPSPHQSSIRQRSQSPAKSRASSPYRRRSYDGQRANPTARQTSRPSSQGIQAYAPTRTDYQYQQSYLMMQRPGAPRQYPQSFVQATPTPMVPPRQMPIVTASQPRAPATQSAPPASSAAQTYPQPVHQVAAPSDRPSAVVFPQPGQVPNVRPIPDILPKSRHVSVPASAREDISAVTHQSYDPLSVHDPYCPPHLANFLGGKSKSTTGPAVDPVSAYGTQWPPHSEHPTPGCSVLGPVFEKPTERDVGKSTTAPDLPLQVETTELQQSQAERKPLPDAELSWEERTRQAWERIRNGLITFGEPKETESATLSPCSDCGTRDAVSNAQPPEPVILPEAPTNESAVTSSGVEPMVLPENRSLLQPPPSTAPQLYLSSNGSHQTAVSRPPGILKQPSYDRRVTFGAPTEKIYQDDGPADDESRSYDGSRSPRRRRVFRGRKLLQALFQRGKGGQGKVISSLPHLNTRSTDASSVSGSVTQEWDGGYYYAPHLIEGTVRDPREPQQQSTPPLPSQPYNLSCPDPVYYP